MRIIHVICDLEIGGAESFVVDLCNCQAKSAEVWILVTNAAVDKSLINLLSGDVKLVENGRAPGSRSLIPIYRLIKTIRSIRPDIVHAHNDAFAYLSPFIPSARFVLTIHDTNLPLGARLSVFDRITAVSNAVKEEVERRFPNVSAEVIHNGIDFSHIPSSRWFPYRPFRVVQVSRLDHEKKGQDILLRAINTFRRQWPNVEILADFIGGGPSETYLRHLSAQLGLIDNVRFLGPQPRNVVYESLCSYNLLVQPSRYEGFGLTVAEGMAAKLPVVVSNLEGPLEIVGFGQHGFVFESQNPEDCARKIASAYRLFSSGKIVRVVERSYEFARSEFDIRNVASRYLSMYSELKGRCSSRTMLRN